MNSRLKFRKSIGEQIRLRRLDRGWSQEELGFASNTHRTYIGALERGEKAITVEKLAQLANAMGYKASAILEGAGL
jgi:transcriptional regulator with XRE-family HTH domain